MSEVKLLKFTTGEEVVATIVKETQDQMILKNGMTMVFNGQAMQAIPFSMNIDDGTEISINKAQLQFVTTPREDLLTQYQAQYSSIITPPKTLIT